MTYKRIDPKKLTEQIDIAGKYGDSFTENALIAVQESLEPDEPKEEKVTQAKCPNRSPNAMGHACDTCFPQPEPEYDCHDDGKVSQHTCQPDPNRPNTDPEEGWVKPKEYCSHVGNATTRVGDQWICQKCCDCHCHHEGIRNCPDRPEPTVCEHCKPAHRQETH